MNLAAYDGFVAAASAVGLRIALAAGGILVVDVTAMATYVLRNGERDAPDNGSTTVDRPMAPIFFNGLGITKGMSKRKTLGSSSGTISDESRRDHQKAKQVFAARKLAERS